MTSGELSPWAAGPPGRPTGPPPGAYAGPPPWAGPPPQAPWATAPPWVATGPVGPSDDQLRQLPPPPVAYPASFGVVATDQRPAVIGLAATLAVTASLLWVCGLSLFFFVAVVGTESISPTGGDSVVFHVLDEFTLRMGDGLWLPLYGFPVASTVTGFLLLGRRPWTRIAHSAVGVAALGWAAFWLRDSLLPWFVVAVYVGVAVAVLWVPSVGRWYAARPRRARPVPWELRG